MQITNPFQYPTLERVTASDGTRFYVSPDTGKYLPSVTTILDHTKDKTHLIEWANRIGQKKADEIRDEAAALGTLVHTHMECHIQGIDRPGGNNLIRQMATRMSDVIIREAMHDVNDVWGYEIPLYFPDEYAGTTDLVGVFQGKEAIMDYKNTKKMKTKDQIVDYFCQGSAYALSHNKLYGTNIQRVAIFMIARDLQYKTYMIEGNEFQQYADQWQRRVDEYAKTGATQFNEGVEITRYVSTPGG